MILIVGSDSIETLHDETSVLTGIVPLPVSGEE
jgi:hypothetical protein